MRSQSSSSSSLQSEFHFTVQKEDGGKDIYCRPSLRLKPHPPELPPRNTPRNSALLSSPPTSPDYMDVEEEGTPPATKTAAPPKPARNPPRNCAHCSEALENNGRTINSNGDLFHADCFVCAQCFQPFKDGVFYEFDNRKYCQHDFQVIFPRPSESIHQVLFAPCCMKCGEFITGRVIRALSASWHPACLSCHHCDRPVADIGFSKVEGRAVCKECALKLRQDNGSKNCRRCELLDPPSLVSRCHGAIEGAPLRWQGDPYHPYHFTCTGCRVELTATAREVRSRPGLSANMVNQLYCLRCHDRMNIPICGACRCCGRERR